MSEPIRIRSRRRDGVTEVVLLMPHPMETGMRRDATGAFVAARYITDVTVMLQGRHLLQARLSQAVAQDPLLTLHCRGGKAGDRIRVDWVDNLGDRRSDESVIQADPG